MLAAVPLAVVVALLAARPVAHRLGIGTGLAFLLVLGVAGILAITLVPRPGGPRLPTDLGCLVPEFALPAHGHLFEINDDTLNVALFVPLGLAIGLLVDHPRFQVLLAVAVALPWAVEAIQLAVPALGRDCQSVDLTANLLGLALGVATGFVARLAIRVFRRRTSPRA